MFFTHKKNKQNTEKGCHYKNTEAEKKTLFL